MLIGDFDISYPSLADYSADLEAALESSYNIVINKIGFPSLKKYTKRFKVVVKKQKRTLVGSHGDGRSIPVINISLEAINNYKFKNRVFCIKDF